MVVEVEKKWKRGCVERERKRKREGAGESSAICSLLCSVLEGGGEKRFEMAKSSSHLVRKEKCD